jgi:tetratricopeptide (TPR) repeat protein
LINMGEAFLEVGEPEAALAAAEANLAVAERSGRVAAMAEVELLAARGLLQLGRAEEALRRLARAEAIRSRDSRSAEQGFEEGELLRAELLFRTGELAGARRSVEALLERAGDPRAMDPRRANRLLRAAARIELRAGDGSWAERLAALALEIASRVARTETGSADVGTAALPATRPRSSASAAPARPPAGRRGRGR